MTTYHVLQQDSIYIQQFLATEASLVLLPELTLAGVSNWQVKIFFSQLLVMNIEY